MKKALLGFIFSSLITVAAFGQGQVIFENFLATGYVSYNSANGLKASPGQYTVALLWYSGTGFQQIASYEPSSGNGGDGPGYFMDPSTVLVPTFSATGTFEVQGWTGNFANYAAAVAGSAQIGQTATFANGEGNRGTLPPDVPLPISQPNNPNAGWDGNLILGAPQGVPEPSTLALGGLGATALRLFRRRKR